ncbi:MAG: class I SAM-dependent DNA methyltransferase [Chloroflexi bacterium]|nr:class I SAM-dependent DNA methyltransferase [Chloroflexota bacterium]
MSSPSLPQFIARWQRSTLTERSAAQSHFIDLCRLLGQPTPTEADPTGESYTFEKGVTKSSGGEGFADVWLRGRFAWEYKGKRKNLDAAYRQLQLYRDDLENPKLLVACDFNRFEIHTNFNDTPTRTYRFDLSDMASGSPVPGSTLSPLEMLRALFTDPDRLQPDRTTSQVTEEVAAQFALLSESMRSYGSTPEEAARFLMKLLFCLFAQDVGLLPNHVFTQLVDRTHARATDFTTHLRELFRAMSTGGSFLLEDIPYFDGGLFSDDSAIELASDAMDRLSRACRMDWAGVEPAVFGTLFERSLDPDKRSQLGAHYTSRADIMEIVEPVLMAPLRGEWEVLQTKLAPLTEAGKGKEAQLLLEKFSRRLAGVRVLDPACGSGNFLYVALKQLLGLEKEAIAWAAANGLEVWSPRVSPSQLHGIEINPYAHELAQIVIWIGYLQWMRDNAFPVEERPILRPLDTVLQMDAIMSYDSEGRPAEPEWPDADVIIGNPPFLGDKKMRKELGDKYVEELRSLFQGRVPGGADLVTYWFERTRALIFQGKASRAGLLATQGIRGGTNRTVLERIKEDGDIFLAWSDRPWILDGAAVHVAIVGFDDGTEATRHLNGLPVSTITADLRGDVDLTQARSLPENAGLAFIGGMKKGSFDIPESVAADMLRKPSNPNGETNGRVLRPWINGLDLTRRPRGMWIIDFGLDMPEHEAALYECPFEYVRKNVKPDRDKVRNPLERTRWWLHARPAPDLRAAVGRVTRYIATPRVAKHRLFVFIASNVLPDGQVVAIARDDEYFLGVLHSKPHELWARRMGTQVREAESGFRYTPTTTFETYPFPWPPGKEPGGDPRVEAIAAAARDLVEKRDRWLNPEGATEAQLKDRTLTNLYNQRPTWLAQAHERLDRAVLDAYGWPHDLNDEEILERLLALNLDRAPEDPPRAARGKA